MPDANLDFDFTIVGAGASGLWLALAMYEEGLLDTKKLCIVECDTNKQNDRTWCYWETAPLQPAAMVSKQWPAIYNPSDLSKRQNLTPYHYYHVRSADFYGSVKYQLKDCANITWLMATVTNIEAQKKNVLVATNEKTWLSGRVFTSALPASELALTNVEKPVLWQSFVGWRVQTTTPLFDATCATMMGWDIAQHNATQFVYELPFSATDAMVEVTRFGKDKISKNDAEVLLREYLEKKGANYQIVEEEEGAIPMTAHYDTTQKKWDDQHLVVQIGTIGGAIKPTTGYGFKRMKAHGQAIARALKANAPLPTTRRRWRSRLYDQLLLRILLHQPERGKPIFQRLFATQPLPRILRFLDEKTTLWEEAKIFVKLPIRLFLATLGRHLFYR